jgi:hypothetical protein
VGATTDGVFGQSSTCNGSTSPDRAAIFSQTGQALRMLAPGSCILAAGGAKQGTSMAAPHVAGAVAALASAKSSATNEEIWNALADTGTPVVDSRTTPTVTRNRLDVAAALQALLGGQAQPGAPVSPIGSRSFTVGPSTIALPYDARPGRSYVLEPFGVRNTGAEAASYTFAVEESDLAFATVTPADWFRFVPDTITLQPGESRFVAPRLDVSASASTGGYAAFIRPIDSAATDLLGPAVRVTFDVGDPGDVAVGEPEPDDDGILANPVIVIVLVVGVIVGFVVLRRRSTRAS